VPVAAAAALTQGDLCQAAIAVSTNAAASAASNPAQAMSQCSVAWCGFNDDESQSVHGSRPTPIAPKTTITYCRSVQWPGRMGCLHCRK